MNILEFDLRKVGEERLARAERALTAVELLEQLETDERARNNFKIALKQNGYSKEKIANIMKCLTVNNC